MIAPVDPCDLFVSSCYVAYRERKQGAVVKAEEQAS